MSSRAAVKSPRATASLNARITVSSSTPFNYKPAALSVRHKTVESDNAKISETAAPRCSGSGSSCKSSCIKYCYRVSPSHTTRIPLVTAIDTALGNSAKTDIAYGRSSGALSKSLNIDNILPTFTEHTNKLVSVDSNITSPAYENSTAMTDNSNEVRKFKLQS